MSPDQIQWEDETARKYLTERGGSKAGSHAYLFDKEPDLRKHLPNGSYLAPGEDIETFLDRIDCTREKIIRACHPLDVFGMVDVIPTLINFSGREAIRSAIFHELRAAKKREVKSYVEYESGELFDGNIGIFVQDFCRGRNGSIIEHPHERGIFRVEETFPSVVLGEICDSQGRILNTFGTGLGRKKSYKKPQKEDESVKKAVELYRKVADSGLMPGTHSFQMEFGIDEETGDIRFYQARLFRPFQPMADFDIRDVLDFSGNDQITSAYGVFGVTPREGSEIMHRAELTKEFINRRKGESSAAYAYDNFASRRATPLDVQPRNIKAYLPYGYNVLQHGHFRWMQKADITLVGKGAYIPNRNAGDGMVEPRRPLQKIGETVRVQVFSNGSRGVIRFLK